MTASTVVRALEEHFLASSELIADVCLLPGDGPDPWLGCRAVVAPNGPALSEQWVLMGQQRLAEVFAVASLSAPHPVRIDGLVLLRDGLPRGGGELARAKVQELVARHDRARRALPGAPHPGAARLLERMQAELDLPVDCAPGALLGDDLGIDSLKLLQLRELLAEEFGVEIPDHEVWSLHTLEDVLARLGAATWRGEARSYRWPRLLTEPERGPSLDERFNLTRRGVNWLAAQLGMYVFTANARLWFQAELLHRERLPRRGAYLLCPTHQSMIDSPLLYALFPYAIVHRFMILAYGPYFRVPPLSGIVRMGRVILTGEANTVSDSLKLAYQGLQRDYVVCLFPEGNCSYTGEIMRPRPGVGVLACEAQVPIVPVLFQGSHRLLSPSSPGVRPAKIRAIVGDPIHPPAPRTFERVDYEGLANEWYEAVLRLQREHPWAEGPA
ncbi:MAG: 1-acyl-sn-glycerol-3-phosphate acyltransferase [Planctomycetes bacterium]|nr:1-acyl-sn-glycerol-3-phosphate acyltransferase [Planctomycetota bacterium]